MKIWLMNHYAAHMRVDKGGRHYWFSKYLNRMGHEPVVLCSINKKEQKELWTVSIAEEINTPFVNVRVGGTRDGGFTRVINMVSFYLNVKKAGKQYAKENGKPDVILASSVHPLTLIAGIKLAKHFEVKCICEVRDLWPEAIIVYSKKIKENSLIAKILFAGEKWIYRKADALIFTQEGAPDYLRSKGWDKEHGGPIDMNKVHYINNGVDLEAFNHNREEFSLDDSDINDPETFKVVYTGAIRRVNNVGLIVDAAKIIKEPNIRFIIFGAGDHLELLKQRLVDENIANVVFKGRINKQYIPYVLSKSNVNLLNYDTATSVGFFKYGSSQNKLFEYLASGKPIISTTKINYDVIEKYHCGISDNLWDDKAYADAIMKLYNLPEDEYNAMCENAYKAAKEFNFEKHTEKLIDVIHSTVNV